MDENENEIVDDENSNSQENFGDQREKEGNDDDDSFTSQKIDLDNISVGENQIKINRQWMDLEEDQEIDLKRRNSQRISSQRVLKNFFILPPEGQKEIWQRCVSSFNFEKFEDRLVIAKIWTAKLSYELAEFKLKIINSILRQNGYFIDKKDLKDFLVNDSFLNNIIESCIDISSCDCALFVKVYFFCGHGEKITTLIKELSTWMKDKKLTIGNVLNLLGKHYTCIYQYIVHKECKLDKPLLSLDNLKEIMACINFEQNGNINLDEIYKFLRLICDLLYGQNKNDIQKYITTVLNLLGYKIKGVENSDEAIFDLNKEVNTSEFYKNAQKIETELKFLKAIKVLGFELSLDDNDKNVFVLKENNDIDRLIADLEYFCSDEINAWVKDVNTIAPEDRNEITADHYSTIEIGDSDSFLKMKQNSILSWIKNNENAADRYKPLLNLENKLDEIMLNKRTVDWMIQNVDSGSFEENEFDKVMNTVEKFYVYTYKTETNDYDNPFVCLSLIISFKSLTADMIVKISSYYTKNNQDFELRSSL